MTNPDPADPKPKLHIGTNIIGTLQALVADVRKLKRLVIGVARTTVDAGSTVCNYTTVNATQAFTVAFIKPFESIPQVFLNPGTNVPANVQCSATTITLTGFTIYLKRTDSATPTTISWLAVDTSY